MNGKATTSGVVTMDQVKAVLSAHEHLAVTTRLQICAQLEKLALPIKPEVLESSKAVARMLLDELLGPVEELKNSLICDPAANETSLDDNALSGLILMAKALGRQEDVDALSNLVATMDKNISAAVLLAQLTESIQSLEDATTIICANLESELDKATQLNTQRKRALMKAMFETEHNGAKALLNGLLTILREEGYSMPSNSDSGVPIQLPTHIDELPTLVRQAVRDLIEDVEKTV